MVKDDEFKSKNGMGIEWKEMESTAVEWKQRADETVMVVDRVGFTTGSR